MNTTSARYALRMWTLCVLLPCLALVAIGCGAVAAEGAKVGPSIVTAEASPRVCFPAAQWGPAPDSVRPCVRITRVLEDGSFTYAVSDASGTTRYTAGVGALDR